MKKQSEVILVPTDFSEQSLIALEQAINLSVYFNSQVKLLHVKDTGLGKFFSSSEETLNVEEKLKQIALKYATPEVPIDIIIDQGLVHERITKIASALEANFIVMGVNSGSRFKKRLIGDTALKVVRESSVPVITIKGKHHYEGCRNIVFPLDLTETTTQKISNAIDFAKKGNCSIRVLSVLFTTDDFLVSKLVRQLEEVRKIITAGDVQCTAEIVKAIKGEETTAQVIIDYAHKVEGDMIMIMTQHEADLKEKLLGSTAEEIIMDSDIPVMSVIPKKIQ
ncbi:MAG: universal stress protein [Bacteroidetes bacterium]|nr:universal stress protein [Bacteroidota bacterium]HET6244953.1 universal stress protein [Bacteroidia bacterium]